MHFLIYCFNFSDRNVTSLQRDEVAAPNVTTVFLFYPEKANSLAVPKKKGQSSGVSHEGEV